MKNLIKTIQNAVGVTADGIAGSKTLSAIAAVLKCPANWYSVQRCVGVAADGIAGVKTFTAIASALGIAAGQNIPTQAEVRSGKSVYGASGNEAALVSLTPPYTLYYEGQPVKTIRVHKEAAADLEAALAEVLATYGAEQIHALGLDIYSGCYNDRSTASGKSKSMHAWGVAIDFDGEHNQLTWRKPQARFSGKEYERFIDIMEKHNFLSLGRHSDKDYMHFQRATFS